jgi:CheY-like chemotaxis protein
VTHALVVDDDHDIRQILRLLLEDAGYDVIEAADGIRALEVLRTSPYPLVVLLDLQMPHLDGAGVLGVVAGDSRLAQRHAFILVTGATYSVPLAFANLLVHLSVPMLPKPVDSEALDKAMARAARRLTTNGHRDFAPSRRSTAEG